MPDPSRFCAYCSAELANEDGDLCRFCRTGLEKYTLQNEVIVREYVRLGLCQFGTLLEHHMDFERWLDARGIA